MHLTPQHTICCGLLALDMLCKKITQNQKVELCLLFVKSLLTRFTCKYNKLTVARKERIFPE